MDLSDALASFRLPETVESPRALDDAISNLLYALDAAEADLVSLLGTLTYATYGILEVILTSRSDTAFIFRSRIIKTLQKSSGTPHTSFILCAERLGAFLVGLPPGEITLDRIVIETYGALTASLRAPKSTEGEFQSSKKTKPPVKSQPKVNTKKKRGTTWVDLSIQIPENEANDKDAPSSPQDIKSPTSPITPMTAISKKPNLLEQLKECLEIFFNSCAEGAIEDWAVNNLLNVLKTEDAHSQPSSPVFSIHSTPSSPLIEKALAESPVKSRFTQTPYTSLGPSDIARYLQDAASSKFGEWPVVVSQRGIKHLRHYLETNKDIFLRIEKKIKQLSVGFFSGPNHTKLVGQGQAIPIYTAELGGDLCLIYHIDFGAPTGGSQESQFIRIFGVFSVPDIDTKFWKSVAAQLARRGPEYIQRCEERAEFRLRSKGGKQIKTTPPKLFPPLAASHWKSEGADAEIDESHFLETEANEVGTAPREKVTGLSLLEMDETAEEEGVLPSKFSQLQDSHFPLFLTFDQVRRTTSSCPPSNAHLKFPFDSYADFWRQIASCTSIHAALVYSEFMGVIKGSEASLSQPRRCLDRRTYETLSSRTHSGDDTERSRIYTLFEAYQKQRPSGSYDLADRVHALMEALQAKGLKGQYIDFLYVDEAQDNLIVDASLLRSLCQNPHGLFFAGDTAQTISRDDPNVKRDIRRAIDPQFFQLSTNYRSHSGIVNVAAFIVELINQYFPHSIDSLTPEVSLVDVSAHKPVFFSGRENGSDFQRLISDSESGKVELGAHQVIIVRDEAAVKKLQTEIGRVAVVLTLYESKGMEFDDVLLYDFFTDSTATATDWRAVLLSQQDGRIFDERKHSILQSELKSFYVGLTRAPSSSPEEWAKQAQQYFSKRLFGEASFCFQKAGMDWWARVAQAYGDRQVASRLPEKHPRRLAALAEVARTFDRLGSQAGESDDPKNAQLLFINAAECFVAIPNHSAAAPAFFKAQKYTEAAYHYRMAGMFDEAVDVIRTQAVDPGVAASIEYAAKFEYSRKRDVRSLHKAWKICESKDDFVEFLKDHGFAEQRIQFLDSIAEHEEVGDVLWKAGNHVDALSRYRRSKTPSAIAKSEECLLDGLRLHLTLGSEIWKTNQIVPKLLQFSQQLTLNSDHKIEVSLFQAIVSGRAKDILTHGQTYFQKMESRGALLALDTWLHSNALKGLEVDAITQVADILLVCRHYCHVINAVVQGPELLEKPATQQLLGISPVIDQDAGGGGVVTNRKIRPQSFIFHQAVARIRREDTTKSVVLPKNMVDDMALHGLLHRRNNVLMSVHLHALKSGAFEICSRFLASGRCAAYDEGRCWRGHVLSNAMTIELFNSRFRLHLLIIALLDQFATVKGGFDAEERNRPNMQRIWLSKIFDVCYPDTPRAGNFSDVVPALIPGYGTLMSILKSWLQETYLGLRPRIQFRFFLSNILRITLLATAIDYDEARDYLPKGQWFLDEDVALGDDLLQDDRRPVAGAVLTWFARKTHTRHYLGVYAIKHIVEHNAAIDVDVVTSYIEEVCGHLILNHYMHYMSSNYDGMTMPRSWIIRALMRQSSQSPNGRMPHLLVPVLEAFLERLVGKRDSGKIQFRGNMLWESGPPLSAILRICRCLSLLGVNNRNLQEDVLRALQPLKLLAGVHWPDYVRFSTAVEWGQVEDALQLFMAHSQLDDLVKVIMPPRRLGFNPSGPRHVMCSNDVELLRKLLIGAHIPLSAPLLLPPPPAKPRGNTTQTHRASLSNAMDIAGPPKDVPATAAPTAEAKTEPSKGDEASSANRSSEGPTQMEGVRYTEVHHTKVSIIRKYFLRYRRRCLDRARDPVAAAFEQLVKRLMKGQEVLPRIFLIYLRGPLPHVLKHLHRLKEVSQSEVTSLNKAMQASKHQDLDAHHARGLEIRRIRDATNNLIKDLQPTSEFYLRKSSNTIPSIQEIIEKVKLIPDLVRDIRKLASFPENVDYELGVVPILSDTAPWAPKKPTAKKERRPGLNTQDLDGYDDY
ncbi:hypothetical protein FRC01_008766 [Tulasnella sp. 417]|nr:hypothetical protein FRC01_008766 [Tulasnella sp. 417]